jgi:hypothetical protein
MISSSEEPRNSPDALPRFLCELRLRAPGRNRQNDGRYSGALLHMYQDRDRARHHPRRGRFPRGAKAKVEQMLERAKVRARAPGKPTTARR